jgi:hypothetical protein
VGGGGGSVDVGDGGLADSTCTLVYDFATPESTDPGDDTDQPAFRISATGQTRNIGAGQLVLRVQSAGTTPVSGTVEVLSYWMRQFFSSDFLGTNVETETFTCQSADDFTVAAPDFEPTMSPPDPSDESTTCLGSDNATALATGTIIVDGGDEAVTFACTDDDYGGTSYTPADAVSTDPGCLTHFMSYGRVRCTSGLCGTAGAPGEDWEAKTAKWSQVLLPITLGDDFGTIAMGDPTGNAEDDFAQVPNDDSGWTGLAWQGTLNAAESTCFQ